jgi:hypothetical protein
LLAVSALFRPRGLEVVDVEQLSTHGGSLRVHARAAGSAPVSPRVDCAARRGARRRPRRARDL